MDILVTFEDGTAELRAASSRAVVGSHGVSAAVLATVNGSALSGFRGEAACVKRGGVWTPCKVESVDEQIARLTRERDAAEKRAARWKHAAKRLWWVLRGAEQDIGHLRRGARAMIGALRPGEFNDWKPSSLAADLVVWAEHVAGLSARADAAEKRLADLRSLIATTARRHESKRGDKQTTAAANALAEELFRVLGEFAMGPELT